MKTYYITYGKGTKLAGYFSKLTAESILDAYDEAYYFVGINNFDKCLTRLQFTRLPNSQDLSEVPLQEQGGSL